jgi:hypothetical protein
MLFEPFLFQLEVIHLVNDAWLLFESCQSLNPNLHDKEQFGEFATLNRVFIDRFNVALQEFELCLQFHFYA